MSALLGLYGLWGIAWLGRHLGEFPHYYDTFQYLRFAERMSVNEHRGIAYPWLLAAVGGSCLSEPNGGVPAWRREQEDGDGRSCELPTCWTRVQLLQVGASLAAIAYFLAVVVRPVRFRRQPWAWLAAAGLLAVDPLLAHHQLALMTDGLAFSGALVFCGSLFGLVFARRGWMGHGALLLLSGLATSSLRVEKGMILVATLALTLGIWGFLGWRKSDLRHALPWRRAAVAVALAVLAVGTSAALHARLSQPSRWWSLGETTVHFRVVFRNLVAVYDELPAEVRAALSREDAAFYDGSINHVRRVMNRITDNEDARRRPLTAAMARTVWEHRRWIVVLDTAHDVLENALSTLAFWARIASREAGLWPAHRRWLETGTAYWTYTRFTFHHRPWGTPYLIASLAVLSAVGVAALTTRPWRGRIGAAELTAWAPAIAFWLVNAAAFGASINITNFRYMLFSHFMLLAPPLLGCLGWLWPAAERLTRASA